MARTYRIYINGPVSDRYANFITNDLPQNEFITPRMTVTSMNRTSNECYFDFVYEVIGGQSGIPTTPEEDYFAANIEIVKNVLKDNIYLIDRTDD
jgi:hypothetical protein